jgi:hypothetical protein
LAGLLIFNLNFWSRRKVGNIMDDANVFVYTGAGGAGGAEIPRDVARVRVDSSVTSIPRFVFAGRRKLAEVELCEGLVEIGQSSFMFCEHSITKINIPNSLRTIGIQAFWNSLRCPFRLHDGIESIGIAAFFGCIFTNFRVPSFITVIPDQMLSSCKSLFSLELPEIVLEIGSGAFKSCYCLRNVAFPPNGVFGNNIFLDNEMDIITDLRDLQLLFSSVTEIIWALQHRFDGLPIHSLVYYQSYQQGVLQILVDIMNMRYCQRQTIGSKLDPTGNQQDCLGMTPLHILTCSSVHSLEIYRLIVEHYPANLITEDRWGALPLLYACWGAAPTEIIQFLIISYRSLYPDHVLNWTMMVETMWNTGTPKECIVCLLCVKQKHFPEQPLNWDRLLFKIANSLLVSIGALSQRFLFQERMCILLMCSV